MPTRCPTGRERRPTAPTRRRSRATATPAEAPPQPPFEGDFKKAVAAIAEDRKAAEAGKGADHYELHFYESVAMRDGRDANKSCH